MKKAILWTVLIAATAIAIGYAIRPRAPGPEAPAAAAPAESDAPAVATAESAAEEATAPPAEEDSPAIREFKAYKAFEARLREFLERAKTMPIEERMREASALGTAIETQEQAGRLRPVEAMMLRLALTRETTTDPGTLRTQAQALARELDAQAAARGVPAPDPRLDAYKAREAEIVAEVMRMPAGPERDALLRKRLEQARVEAYR